MPTSDPCLPPDCVPDDAPNVNAAPPGPEGNPVPVVGVPVPSDATTAAVAASASVTSLPSLPRDN